MHAAAAWGQVDAGGVRWAEDAVYMRRRCARLVRVCRPARSASRTTRPGTHTARGSTLTSGTASTTA